MVEAVAARAAELNADAQSAKLDHAALDAAIRAQGEAFHNAISVGHPHLFADVPLFVTAEQIAQMKEVISAVEQVVKLDAWQDAIQEPTLSHKCEREQTHTKGVFYGYDFHLNEQGAHLIEINSNAGGGFLNAWLLDSQRATGLPGKSVAGENIEQSFLAMFRNEWRLERGDVPLQTIAIVDERPESQYLYPEFLLVQKMFERAGIAALIVDPSALQTHPDGMYCNGLHVDLIYNRLTDFDLQQHPQICSAYESQLMVLTPSPAHYHRYADKRKLALLTDTAWLNSAAVPQANINTLLQGIPQTRIVLAENAEQWWAERKQWFFKPASGYGSKGAYRGDKLTRRVFEEIMQSDYVAQRLALPGERTLSVDGEEVALKYDVRCYVYDGEVQLIAARLYQGQTTNFRTPGGGFAIVRDVS